MLSFKVHLTFKYIEINGSLEHTQISFNNLIVFDSNTIERDVPSLIELN